MDFQTFLSNEHQISPGVLDLADSSLGTGVGRGGGERREDEGLLFSSQIIFKERSEPVKKSLKSVK